MHLQKPYEMLSNIQMHARTIITDVCSSLASLVFYANRNRKSQTKHSRVRAATRMDGWLVSIIIFRITCVLMLCGGKALSFTVSASFVEIYDNAKRKKWLISVCL